MMSKRFEMRGDTHIFDLQTNEEYYAPSEYELVGLLNSLNDELVYFRGQEDNEMNVLQKENERLKEQLQMIERIIQTQITEREEDLRVSIKAGMPTGGLYSEIGFLEELKKECFDE